MYTHDLHKMQKSQQHCDVASHCQCVCVSVCTFVSVWTVVNHTSVDITHDFF